MKERKADPLRRCVELILTESRSEAFRSVREYRQMSPGIAGSRRGERAIEALASFLGNSVPGLHLLRARRRLSARVLGIMHGICWDVGFDKGCDVQEPEDYHRILLRWVQECAEPVTGDGSPAFDYVVDKVSSKLRVAYFRILILGFVPIIGASAGLLIEASMVRRFQQCAYGFYVVLASTGARSLPAGCTGEERVSKRPDARQQGPAISFERWVERYWESHLTDDVQRRARAAAPVAGSPFLVRLLSGSSGVLGSCLPGLHVAAYREIETMLLLETLQAICWRAAVQHGCEAEHARHFEWLLWRWAHARPTQWDNSDREPRDQQRLIMAVSDSLRNAYPWKLAFGFIPIVGAVVGFAINGSMGTRFYRLTREFYERGGD